MGVFDDTFIPPGRSDVRPAGRHCPRCVWPYLHRVGSIDQSQLLCDSCGHSWRVEDGRLCPVDPLLPQNGPILS